MDLSDIAGTIRAFCYIGLGITFLLRAAYRSAQGNHLQAATNGGLSCFFFLSIAFVITGNSVIPIFATTPLLAVLLILNLIYTWQQGFNVRLKR